MADKLPAYADPASPHNGPKYRTGRQCIERGRTNPAGTAWTPLWCQPCNAKRMASVTQNLDRMVGELESAARPAPDGEQR